MEPVTIESTLVLMAPTSLVRGALEHAQVSALLPMAESLEHAREIVGARSTAKDSAQSAPPTDRA